MTVIGSAPRLRRWSVLGDHFSQFIDATSELRILLGELLHSVFGQAGPQEDLFDR